ncbi:MAG TPA: hypothetical protein ENI29_14725 [bacterium]|nr:hypothetical protein [bacterium]
MSIFYNKKPFFTVKIQKFGKKNMNKKKFLKLKRKFLTVFLLFTTLSSIFTIFPMNSVNLEKDNHANGKDIKDEVKKPFLSEIGSAQWWNSSFEYRRLINITNTHEIFTNFITSVNFNYKTLVDVGKLNQSLKDIRIVENGILKNYFIEMDFPVKNNATIWFETDSAPGLEIDTYMYYGNNNTGFASSYLMNRNPDGLIWYKFEEINGGEVVDSMGNYNATVNGPIISADSAVGSFSLLFDGIDDYLAIKDLYFNTPNGLTEFTVLSFFKTSGGGSYTNNWAIFDFDRSEHFNFYVRGDGGLGFSSFANGWDETSNWDPNEDPYVDNNYDDFNTPTNGLNDNTWHFGGALYDGTDKVLYIDDGVEDARNDNAHNGLGIGDTTLRYGIIGDGSEATSEGSPRNAFYYNGLLDEIRFFEEALSPERIEWIAKNFTLLTQLNEEQEKRTTITVIAKDIDGRVVPGLEIYMYNVSGENYQDTTGDRGSVEFPDVKREKYVITANYSIFNGTHTFEEVVFNSSNYDIIYDFSGLGDFHTVYINVSLWSIDFEIEDWDEDPMGYGYVLVYNKSDYTELVANMTLNKEMGTQTFRWINTSNDAAYYYEVYYYNEDYSQQHNLVHRNFVNRTVYLNKKLHVTPKLFVNETNVHISPIQIYAVEEKVYASGSDENKTGNIKIINITITLDKMYDDLDELDIYSIDVNNNRSASPIFSKVYTTETSDTIELDILELVDAYGLLLYIKGTNSTDICNGTIDVSYTETHNQYVKVNMSKLEINVYDTNGVWDPTYGNVFVNVFNGTPGAGENIVTLLTDDQGAAKGQINSELDFWYFTNTLYNITLTYSGSLRNFNISSDQYTTPFGIYWDHFNYTLNAFSSIELRIQLDIANFKTEFQENIWEIDKEWSLTFDFSVRFMSTDNATNPSPTWNPITNPTYVKWEVTDLLGDLVFESGSMTPVVSGYYNYTIDSGELIGGDQYYFTVYGRITGYQDPNPAKLLFTVSPKTTTIGVYNTSDLTSLGGNVTQFYGEQLNLTVLYRSDSILLEEAIVSYEWQFTDDPITIVESPAGEYSFVINTSIADVGTYQVRINAAKENYSYFQDYRFDVTIINRPTELNGDESLHLISKTIWVREAYNFIFEYEDIFTVPHVKLTDLDQAYYQWYEISNGSIVGTISNLIDLVEGSNSTLILDFNTASRDVGDYALFVTVQKNNYDVRTALIDLTVKERIISWDLTATNLVQSGVKVDQGENIVIEFILTDLAEPPGQQAITGATILLTLGSDEYPLVEKVNGTYTYTLTTGSIDTFFAAKVLTGEFTITKEDYIKISIPITIVVDMTEIFPGFPMFYFLMIVGSIAAVAGSLVIYRVIQQRRIPTFVKKVRSMKKNIKGKKNIPNSLLYPSKEQFIVKKFGDKWGKLGLSIEEILGIKGKVKKEKRPEDKIKKIKLDEKKIKKEKLKQDKLEKKKLEDNEVPKEKGEDE